MADLLSAIEVAAAGDVSGAFAVGSAGWLEQDQVEELSGLLADRASGRRDVRDRAAAAPGGHHPGAGF